MEKHQVRRIPNNNKNREFLDVPVRKCKSLDFFVAGRRQQTRRSTRQKNSENVSQQVKAQTSLCEQAWQYRPWNEYFDFQ